MIHNVEVEAIPVGDGIKEVNGRAAKGVCANLESFLGIISMSLAS